MKLKIQELKQLAFELYGAMVTNTETKEQIVLTQGLLKQKLDLKTKFLLNKFGKQLSEALPEAEEESQEVLETEYDISNLIINLTPELGESIGKIETNEDYPILMNILFRD